MEYRSGSQIREDFLRFFEGKGHRRVHSSSLVPANDPTLLFTNAGMNQFKDVFLGLEKRAYTRAASSQKCVRAGGKHNDLENVGFTRRHHTFFEMLGNFSFGDYFKREAIAYAWELLTSPQWFGIDPAKLYVTIFEGEGNVPRDDEAFGYWVEVGVPAERIFAMPGKDNFWAMGDTGPCGPCSEIFYDLGMEAAETPGVDLPFPQDEQRYVEIWNLVFMQFDRSVDEYACSSHPSSKGPEPKLCDIVINQLGQKCGLLTMPANYRLDSLPRPSIDTGMGLERIAAVLQGVLSNYETDLFTPLIKRAAELTDLNVLEAIASGGGAAHMREGQFDTWGFLAISDVKGAASLRIIADHARAATFLISDEVEPGKGKREYVLRKILRRGIWHGRLLGRAEPFMYRMVDAVVLEMKTAYPELVGRATYIAKVVLAEEERFGRTLTAALPKLNRAIDAGREWLANTTDEALRAVSIFNVNSDESIYQLRTRGREFDGKAAFELFETYGLPKDFIQDTARDADLSFDDPGFEKAKEEEQARARASWKGGSQKSAAPVYRELAKTEFEGYSALRVDGARVLALVREGVGVNELPAGEAGEVVLDATSFYADSGGQVGDVGWLYSADHNTVVADVSGCSKPVQGVFAHRVVARERMAVGDVVDTVVDGDVRRATMRNHTGTHLLHAALREVLGKHVKQAGSLVDRSRLRFDFSHFAGVADEELQQIEDIVNAQVLGNAKVETLVDVPIDVAVNELGAMALFGEKYGDRVRVVTIGGPHGFSTELCGGTHVGATGEIGLIKLVGEGSVSSGVRRVEAVTGAGSLEAFRRDADVAKVATHFAGGGEGAPAEALRARLVAQEDEVKRLRREIEQMRMKSASAATAGAASSAIDVKGVKVLSRRVDALDKSQMRNLVDELRGKLGSGVVVLGAAAGGRVSLIVGVTKDLTGRVQAGKIVSQLAGMVGGKGGGRPDLAEAGGTDAAGLDGALAKAAGVVEALLG